jgi:outer membrane lipoprotein
MRRLLPMMLIGLMVLSCAPVLRYDLMKRGIFDVRLSDIKKTPAPHRGKLFILGGIIVKTTATKEGSLIEASYVPVDSRGYLKNISASNGRFLALYKGFLDPLIFRHKRELTIAGVFRGTRLGKIDEMNYTYPFFEIEELYLWEEMRDYYRSYPYPPSYYPYWRYGPWWYDPWWHDPWWRY